MLLSQPCLLRGDSLEDTQQEPPGRRRGPRRAGMGRIGQGQVQEDRGSPESMEMKTRLKCEYGSSEDWAACSGLECREGTELGSQRRRPFPCLTGEGSVE